MEGKFRKGKTLDEFEVQLVAKEQAAAAILARPSGVKSINSPDGGDFLCSAGGYVEDDELSDITDDLSDIDEAELLQRKLTPIPLSSANPMSVVT